MCVCACVCVCVRLSGAPPWPTCDGVGDVCVFVCVCQAVWYTSMAYVRRRWRRVCVCVCVCVCFRPSGMPLWPTCYSVGGKEVCMCMHACTCVFVFCVVCVCMCVCVSVCVYVCVCQQCSHIQALSSISHLVQFILFLHNCPFPEVPLKGSYGDACLGLRWP